MGFGCKDNSAKKRISLIALLLSGPAAEKRGVVMPPKSGATTKGKPAAATSSKSKKKCTISDADARNLQKTFAEYDADNSGEISLIELQHFFAKSSAEL